jgi:hypothetical protein
MTEKTYGGKTLAELEELAKESLETCTYCSGMGETVKFTRYPHRQSCPYCNGSGWAGKAIKRGIIPLLLARIKELEADVEEAKQLANTEAGIAQEHINACAHHSDRVEVIKTLIEYYQLQAERNAPEKLLAEVPVDHVIDRMGLESRKQEIDALLAAQSAPSREPVQAHLTFRGKPFKQWNKYKARTEAAEARVKELIAEVKRLKKLENMFDILKYRVQQKETTK